VSSGTAGADEFERQAAEALAAWREKRFQLPDYYVVIAPTQGSDAGPDLYLGPLRMLRSRRVVIGGTAAGADQPGSTQEAEVEAMRVEDALRSLEHGPWWPPLDEILDAARGFYAGGLASA
jgi:hypothetical protein